MNSLNTNINNNINLSEDNNKILGDINNDNSILGNSTGILKNTIRLNFEENKINNKTSNIKEVTDTLPLKYRNSLSPNKSILNTRNRMLFVLKQKNEYKKKVIYSQFSVILLITLLIIAIIYSSK